MTEEAITHAAHAFVLGPGEGRQINNPPGDTITFKATGAESGGSVLVMASVIAPGEGPPLHVHADMDEIIYVLEGQLRVHLGADLHQASPRRVRVHPARDGAHLAERRRRPGHVRGLWPRGLDGGGRTTAAM